MVETGQKLDQNIVGVDICHNILAAKIYSVEPKDSNKPP